SGVLTTQARSAPVIGGLDRTRATSVSGSAPEELMRARIAPRSRRGRGSALVPLIAIAVTPPASSSSWGVRAARQSDAIGLGFRITKPLTQIRRDSLSSSLIPVLPI